MFDLAVNGGGQLTVKFERPGYCPVQRQVVTPWTDYLCLPDVILMAMDPVANPVTLGNNSFQLARGSAQTDGDGARQATLLLSAGTSANLVVNGAAQKVNSLNIRATEFTVGTKGSATMPAPLPGNSAFTYCVELSADEAVAAGASTVQFDRPLYFYVENFLGFPAGQAVPTGYFDRDKKAWVASPNGRVIKVLSVSNGIAAVDANGDGGPDSAAELGSLGFTDEELRRVASLYVPGQTLWRVAVTHFSPWDCNWPGGPPPDAKSPPTPGGGPNPDDNCPGSGSIIQIERQSLGEAVDIVGTHFQLHYHSRRARGYLPPYTLRIPLSENSIPASLKRIDLQIEVAGRLFNQSFSPTTNQLFVFTWDGLDAYGRTLAGSYPVTVRLGYVYPASYYLPGQFEQAFARFSDSVVAGNRAREEITIWKSWKGFVGNLLSDTAGLGNWTFDIHHAYDPRSRTLHFGDGRRRSANALDLTVIRTFAGGAFASPANGDGGPATGARLAVPSGLAVAADGSVYIAEGVGQRVRKVLPNGTITTIVGSLNGQNCGGNTNPCGDGGPALSALLSSPAGIALGPDGALYIADRGSSRIRKVDTNGIIVTIAGTGVAAFTGDGGPATQATLNSPYGVSVGPDGLVYICDTGNSRVRRIGADGIITTIVGGPIIPGVAIGDGGPASQAELNSPYRVTFGSDGSMYIVDRGQGRIRRIGADGIISTVAGTGKISSYGGDGGQAALADLNGPGDIAIAADGSFYIADQGNLRVRLVGPEGVISTFAGTGISGYSGDGGPATGAKLDEPTDVALGPDGSLFISDWFNGRVRKVSSALPGFSDEEILIPAEDGGEVYVFDNSGRHLQTLDGFTKAVRYQFSYDSEGHLNTIEDGDHNVTTVERDASGLARAIISPYQQKTTFTLDTNGYFASITNPANERFSFTYGDTGLMAAMTNPRSNIWNFAYDDFGRLIEDRDPIGGFKALARVEGSAEFSVEVRTALGRTNRYDVSQLPAGSQQEIVTFPTGLQTQSWQGTDGSTTNHYADGVVVTEQMGPDPRWGMLASLPASNITVFPGGITNVSSVSRTVILADPNDPFSLTHLVDTNIVNGRIYLRTFNTTNRVETNSTPAGRQIVTTYDSLMRPIRQEMPGLAPIQYSYDSRGRLASTIWGTETRARTNLYFYDGSGNLTNVVDPLGRSTAYAYDLAGRLTRTTLPGDRLVQNSYDPDGNLVGVSPPDRPVHSFAYSPVDLTTNYSPPIVFSGTNSTTYQFDVDRELTSILRPDGITVNYDWTASGCYCDRLNTIIHPRGTNTYTYDPVTGNLSRLTSPDGVELDFAYSGSFVTQEAWNGTAKGAVDYAFDNDLDVTSRRVNSGTPVSFDYDPDKLLTGAGNLAIQRNETNGLVTGTSLGGITDSWTYDEFGQPTNYSAFFGTTTLYAFHTVRDPFGRITARTETIGGVTTDYGYTYDPADRLAAVTGDGSARGNYIYDSNDNRITVSDDRGTLSANYDNQDRQLSLGVIRFTWTANGELAAKSEGNQITNYKYDVFGNLLGVTLPNELVIDYLIDGRNRRVGKKVNGAMVQGFVYERALRPAAELNGSGAISSEFIYATRGNVPDYLIKAGQTYRILCDEVGSPRLVVNAATGQVAQRLDYDTFGRVLTDTAPGFQPFGFAGGIYDPDTALVRFGARDYDPETGRWTAKDAILFGGGQANLYAYVDNDPLNKRDPGGLAGFDLKQWQQKNAKDLADSYKQQAQNSKSNKSCLTEYKETKDKAEKNATDASQEMNKDQKNIWEGIKDALKGFGK
jgi:RHS repeat-associated protein